MNGKPLSRLERVDLRTIWTIEATEFTPWLAQSENLEVLGETLGIDLELEAQEAVGPFRADILCKDIGTRHPPGAMRRIAYRFAAAVEFLGRLADQGTALAMFAGAAILSLRSRATRSVVWR